MNGEPMTVRAAEVKDGDFLPGLGNGYVFQDAEETDTYDNMVGIGRHYTVPEGMVLIHFHDADGDENYLVVGADNPVSVERSGGF